MPLRALIIGQSTLDKSGKRCSTWYIMNQIIWIGTNWIVFGFWTWDSICCHALLLKGVSKFNFALFSASHGLAVLAFNSQQCGESLDLHGLQPRIESTSEKFHQRQMLSISSITLKISKLYMKIAKTE